ncbi:hypothetical protein BT93_E0664 [Corymbia citriodora subsp. variegata]|nr:hypothetical protein BT93_E0664 [Corymbia citriodora subsp. variegata]
MASMLVFFSMSLFSLLFLQVITSASTSAEACPVTKCSPTGPEIRFPFRIRDVQGEHCGYEGFDVSCDDWSRTILHLPEAGDFVVDSINYVDQYILVKDPNDCLLKRLLENESVTSYSPFLALWRKNSTFANCSSEHSSRMALKSGFMPVDCLSQTSHVVLVMVWEDDDAAWRWLSKLGCYTWTAQIPRVFIYIMAPPIFLGLSKAAQFAIALLSMLPWFVGIFGCMWFLKVWVFCRWGLDPMGSDGVADATPSDAIEAARHNVSGVMDIDSPAIESYPKTQIDDLQQLARSDEDVCVICLSKYEPKEMIRTIPECEHYFHADCIEQWLRKKASCPLCRNNKG